MKTIAAVLLTSSLTFADPPADSPVLAPDEPGVSVRLRAGETAQFDGRLLSLEESRNTGKKLASCRGELADAKTNEWMSKPVLVALIIGSVALGAAAGAGVTVYALKKSP